MSRAHVTIALPALFLLLLVGDTHGDDAPAVPLDTATDQTLEAERGTSLCPGDRLRMPAGTSGEIVLRRPWTIVRMRGGTDVELLPDHPARAPQLELHAGALWIRVVDRGRDLSVRAGDTRVERADDGTDFLVEREEGKTTVRVLEGRVHVATSPGAEAEPRTAVEDSAPPNVWWQAAEGLRVFHDAFDRLDEARWGRFTYGGTRADFVGQRDGQVTFSQPEKGGHGPFGISTREPAVKMPADEALVLELRFDAASMPATARLTIGLHPLPTLKSEAQPDPWDPWAQTGPALHLSRKACNLFLTTPERECVIRGPAAKGGVRLVIEPEGADTNARLSLTDLEGRPLPSCAVTAASETGLRPGTWWYVSVYGTAWPVGGAVEAALDEIRVGPRSRIGRGASTAHAPSSTPDSGTVSDASVPPSGREVRPGETVSFPVEPGPDWTKRAWVALVPASTPRGSQAAAEKAKRAWESLRGRTSGQAELVVPLSTPLGRYELRAFPDDDDRHPETACLAELQVVAHSATITLDRETARPGEVIRLAIEASPGFQRSAWVALVPADTPAGQGAADARRLDWRPFGVKRSLSLGFEIPRNTPPGSYHFRLYPSDENRFPEAARSVVLRVPR